MNLGVPCIDVSSLVTGRGDTARVAAELEGACRDAGFFYVTGHGIDAGLQERLEAASREFFALPHDEKMKIEMARGGCAWRGYFPVGNELTLGRPDLKEGLYFGSELGPEHPAVSAGTPMHGANLFPETVPQLRRAVLEYMEAATALGHALMRGISESLSFPPDYFQRYFTSDPLVLFRIFSYPVPAERDPRDAPTWGVGEHTDYGLLTILKQDDCGGLEVKTTAGWVAAPPIPGSFVCNIGDMLDRMTGGRYRSTPHRVRNTSGRARFSWPFFFDPGFGAKMRRLPLPSLGLANPQAVERWDGEDVHLFDGTYGEYLLRKVGRVFPDLKNKAL